VPPISARNSKARPGIGLAGRAEDAALCRYITRPAIANERPQRNRVGDVVLPLKTPCQEGTTHIVMSPLELLQRLAALVPRPRLHLIRFHGVLAPNAKLRPRRARRVLDETNPADMVEHHVVRSGVDELRLEALLLDRFDDVMSWKYWSTQSPVLQAAGDCLGLETTFGLVGRDRCA
jgi:hypothetical protein